ncbi:MAG TPA: hypothetical protein VLT81_13980, partial [Chondromyces sp.]|nr:hypothetical protein [Chondromyces sp.]
AQADYLVRYYLLALGTGLVERVFWWRLMARGYGLIAPGGDGSRRRRPAWYAMRTMIDHLEGSTFHAPLPAPDGTRLCRFRREDGGEVVVGWSLEGSARAVLPRPAVEVITRDGALLPLEPGAEVVLGPSPTYFHLERP